MTNQIAEAWRPHLYLEVRSGSDVLCALPPIGTLNDRTWEYERVDTAPVYFKAMEGEGWKAVLYLFYFRNDPKGMHLHDLTGILLFRRYAQFLRAVTRQHNHLTFYDETADRFDKDVVVLSAGDHTPGIVGQRTVTVPHINYGETYPLIDLDTIDLSPYRAAFAPSVSFPDEWSCTRADAFLKQTPKGRELAKKLGIKTVRGLIVTAPDKLITVLEAM